MEIEKIIPDSVKEVQMKKQKEKKYELQRSIIHQRGHTLFEIDTNTLEVREPFYEESKKVYLDKPQENKKVIIKKDCVYLEALNVKNALKKYKKLNNS